MVAAGPVPPPKPPGPRWATSLTGETQGQKWGGVTAATAAPLLFRYSVRPEGSGRAWGADSCPSAGKRRPAPVGTALPPGGLARSQGKGPLESRSERLPKLLDQLMSYLL